MPLPYQQLALVIFFSTELYIRADFNTCFLGGHFQIQFTCTYAYLFHFIPVQLPTWGVFQSTKKNSKQNSKWDQIVQKISW